MGFDSHYNVDVGAAFKRTRAPAPCLRPGLLRRAALCFAPGSEFCKYPVIPRGLVTRVCLCT